MSARTGPEQSLDLAHAHMRLQVPRVFRISCGMHTATRQGSLLQRLQPHSDTFCALQEGLATFHPQIWVHLGEVQVELQRTGLARLSLRACVGR